MSEEPYVVPVPNNVNKSITAQGSNSLTFFILGYPCMINPNAISTTILLVRKKYHHASEGESRKSPVINC